ncbi:MAG: acyl-[Bacteroidaceae bacterium]|nr:acyl-[acyl-carrier-protein] thioesterase [Bacteroidaceae bacterium]MBR4337864.1 acyl-[acyl-carrier-protein] thioesterase [Bacteroidaceae bacterium]
MNVPLIGESHFIVESFHSDCTSHLSLAVLGNQLLNTAASHAEKLGIGRQALLEQHQAWVFSRLLIQMDHYPYEFETYSIKTWIDSVSRFFSNRHFAIFDAAGKAIGYATSVWALMDLDTRQALDIAQALPDHVDCVAPEHPDCPIARTTRARVTATEPAYTFRPLFCDIDYNGHFNSIRYIEHYLGALPLELLRERPVHRFEISYSTECRYGEELAVYVSNANADEYDLELRKADGTVASRAKAIFNLINS